MSSKNNTANSIDMNVVLRYYKVPAMVFVVVTILGWLAWGQVGEIIESFSRIEKQQAKLAELNDRIESLRNQFGGNYSVIKSVASRALPNEKPIFEAFSAISAVAKETSVTVDNISSTPGDLATGSASLNKQASVSSGRLGGVKSVTMKVRVFGEADNLYSFLEKMLKIVPLMDIDKVAISVKGSGEEEQQEFAAEVELLVYWQATQTSSTLSGNNQFELSAQDQQAVDSLLQFKYYGVN